MDLKQGVQNVNKTKLVSNLKSSKITAVVGVCKNAGKTTFLNWLLQKYSSAAVFTTGRDGEENDLVGRHAKPKVLVPANFFYTCFDYEIKKQASFVKVICKTNFKAANKPLWLVKTMFDVKAEIVGPASTENQIKLCKLLNSYNVSKIFIDGSLDRKSIALNPLINACVLVAGADFGNEKTIFEELQRQIALSTIKQVNINAKLANDICAIYANDSVKNLGIGQLYKNESKVIKAAENAEYIYIPGAITDLSYNKISSFIKNNKVKWIFKHPVAIKTTNFNWLEKANCVTSYKLKGIALNGYSTKGKHVNLENTMQKLNSLYPNLPTIDVKSI